MTPTDVQATRERHAALVKIKLLHTVVWLLFAGCIIALPIVGALGYYLWAATLTGLILVECIVLAINRCSCPLTGVAARYTDQRTANFDIYLPLWLARYNKIIFGVLFVVGGVFVLARWLTQ
jgi:hypothetical protein